MKLSRRRKAAMIVLGLVVFGIGAVGAILWRGIPFPIADRTAPGRPDQLSPDRCFAPGKSLATTPTTVRELMITVHYPADKAARAPRSAIRRRAVGRGNRRGVQHAVVHHSFNALTRLGEAPLPDAGGRISDRDLLAWLRHAAAVLHGDPRRPGESRVRRRQRLSSV